jgi:hypothetical protein
MNASLTKRHRRWPWPSVLLALPWLLTSVALALHYTANKPVVEALAADRTANLFIATSATAGTLLGLVIATLAILVAFPDRPTASRLRRFTGWFVLEYCLLVTAFNLFALLVDTLIGVGVDGFLVRDILVAFALASAAGLLLSGLLFALVLSNLAKADAETDQ